MPTDGLPEPPLGALDLSYDASENVLTARAYFRDLSVVGLPQFEPPVGGVMIAFDDVEAFEAYEEFADPLYAEGREVSSLAETVPYGGHRVSSRYSVPHGWSASWGEAGVGQRIRRVTG